MREGGTHTESGLGRTWWLGAVEEGGGGGARGGGGGAGGRRGRGRGGAGDSGGFGLELALSLDLARNGRLAPGAVAGGDDHRTARPAQDPEGHAAEQAGGQFPAARAAQDDEVGAEGLGLRKYRLGDPVDDRGPDVPGRGNAGHAQFEDRRLDEVAGLAAALPGVPDRAGELSLAQVENLDLGYPLGGKLLDEIQGALVGFLDRHHDPAKHNLTRPYSRDAGYGAFPHLPAATRI